jgi:hypothetical protein
MVFVARRSIIPANEARSCAFTSETAQKVVSLTPIEALLVGGHTIGHSGDGWGLPKW